MILVPQKALAAALGAIERVAPARNANVALTHVMLTVTVDGLQLDASGGDAFLRLTVPCEPGKGGGTLPPLTVPAHVFGSVIRGLSAGTVDLSLSAGVLVVRAGPSRVTIPTGDVAGFPPLTMPQGEPVALDPAQLAGAISAVRYAAATQNFQAMFTGLHLEFKADRFRVVASDGYRLAWFDAPAQSDSGSVVIPARQADEVLRLVKDATRLQMIRHQGDIAFQTDRGTLALRIMAGEYPQYERVVPRLEQLSININAHALRESVTRLSYFAAREDNNRVRVDVRGPLVHLSSAGPLGTCEDVIQADLTAGADRFECSFNARYLLDALAHADGTVVLSFASSTLPMKIIQPGAGNQMHVLALLQEAAA